MRLERPFVGNPRLEVSVPVPKRLAAISVRRRLATRHQLISLQVMDFHKCGYADLALVSRELADGMFEKWLEMKL